MDQSTTGMPNADADRESLQVPESATKLPPASTCSSMSTLLVCFMCVFVNYTIYSMAWNRRLPPPREATLDATDSLPYGNVVMIEATYSTFKPDVPWQTIQTTFQAGVAGAARSRGSGILLRDGFILTAGYIATDSRLITVERQGNGTKYTAKVVAIAPELDLALLKMMDNDMKMGFSQQEDMNIEIEPRKLLGLGREVIVVGFQVDKQESLVRVRSRVARILTKKTDGVKTLGRYAPLKVPAMSLYPELGGTVTVGPVFSVEDGHLAGFLSRTGQVVPAKLVASFVSVTMQGDGKAWDGIGSLGLVVKPMQNPGLRLFWGLADDDLGVQIRSIAPGSPFEKLVKRNDVVTHIDGNEVRASGSVMYMGTEDKPTIMPFEALLGEKPPGATSKFTIFRPELTNVSDSVADSGYTKSKTFEIEVALKSLRPLVPSGTDIQNLDPTTDGGVEAMEQPPYFIVGGLVWATLTQELLTSGKSVNIPPMTQIEALYRWRQNPDEQIVVLLRTLEHECNKLYPGRSTVRVLKLFNNKPVTNLTQLMKNVGAALQAGERYLTFAMKPNGLNNDTAGGEGDPDLVLDTKLCAGSDLELLGSMGVARPASEKLMPLYEKAMPSHFISQKVESDVLTASAARPPSAIRAVDAASGPNANISENEALPWTNVVQLKLFSVKSSQLQPWVKEVEGSSRCSGIIADVKAKMILTNSHCVAGGQSLALYREDMHHGVNAQVVEIARDVDLAWVTTEDESFWASRNLVEKIEMSDALPYLSSSVQVIGYPMGGSGITITQGIISRLDGQRYPNGLSHSARNTPTSNALIIQIDAAINHGNSGGPVFDKAGKLVGLAFSGLSGATLTGYVIPNVYLKNFIQSVHPPDQRWIAQPEVGALFRDIVNPGMRNYLGLKENETGIQVRTVAPFSPLFGEVQKGDLLTSLDGHQVSGDAKVVREFHGKTVSLPFDTLISEKAPGAKSTMTFLRPGSGSESNSSVDRKVFSVTKEFGPLPPLAPRFDDSPMKPNGREAYATSGSYFILWGLVFGVFSTPLLQEAESQKGIAVPWSVTEYAVQRWRENDKQQVIVLMGGLAHPCNLFYDTKTMRVLQTLNGQPITNIMELVKLGVQAQFAVSRFVRLTFEPLADVEIAGTANDPDIVLDRKLCARGMEQLLASHAIPSPVSQDLQQFYEFFGAQAQQELLAKLGEGGDGALSQKEEILETLGRGKHEKMPEIHHQRPVVAAPEVAAGSVDAGLRAQQKKDNQNSMPGASQERPAGSQQDATPKQKGEKQGVPPNPEFSSLVALHQLESISLGDDEAGMLQEERGQQQPVPMSFASHPKASSFSNEEKSAHIHGNDQSVRSEISEESLRSQQAALLLGSGALRQVQPLGY